MSGKLTNNLASFFNIFDILWSLVNLNTLNVLGFFLFIIDNVAKHCSFPYNLLSGCISVIAFGWSIYVQTLVS